MTDWVRPSDFSAALAAVLRAARRDAGLTLRAARRASGGFFRPSAINGYERGQRLVSLDRFCHLAEIYDTTGDELLRRTLAALGHVPPRSPAVARDRAETLRLFYQRVVGEGEGDLIDDLCTPDFIDHEIPARLDLPRTAAGFRSWMEIFHETFSGVVIDVEDKLFVGDQAVVRLEMNLSYRKGGRGVDGRARRLKVPVTEWVRFEGGKLSERWGIDGAWLLEEARSGTVPGVAEQTL